MGNCTSKDSTKQKRRSAPGTMHHHGAHSNAWDAGYIGGGMSWKEREEQRRLEQEARMKALLEEQEELDAMEDEEDRLGAMRKRYKCGDRYVLLEDIETWSSFVPKLKEMPPEHTTVTPEEKAKRSSGMFASANDTIKIKEHDVLRRCEVSAEINDKVSIFRGDITALEVDGVVNAAKESLLGGGGIDGAIHSAAGSLLVHECSKLNGCKTGNTKITRGYKLPAKHVLHTVGPIGSGDKELRSCYETTLQVAKENGLRTVAFCCVGTGIFGFPLVRATHIALETVRSWLEVEENRTSVDRLIFCVFRDVEVESYERIMPSYFPIDEFPEEFTEEPGILPPAAAVHPAVAPAPAPGAVNGESPTAKRKSAGEPVVGDELRNKKKQEKAEAKKGCCA